MAQSNLPQIPTSTSQEIQNDALKELEIATEKIRRYNGVLSATFFAVAIELKRVDDSQLYQAKGYDTIYQYAEVEFGYKRAATNNFVRIAKFYLQGNDENAKSIFANDNKDFTMSQLQEFLPAPIENVKKLVASGEITSEMSTKKIREKIKSIKPQKAKKVAKADIEISGLSAIETAGMSGTSIIENASLSAIETAGMSTIENSGLSAIEIAGNSSIIENAPFSFKMTAMAISDNESSDDNQSFSVNTASINENAASTVEKDSESKIVGEIEMLKKENERLKDIEECYSALLKTFAEMKEENDALKKENAALKKQLKEKGQKK